MTDRVAIVGAGLAGCLLATLLARRGIEVTVYERRDDPRVAGPERGRSINLAISARGLQALDQVGLRELSLSRALPMHGRMVHDRAGGQSFRPYSADGAHAINSISRTELNMALLEDSERARGVCLRFAHRLRELDMTTGELWFETPDGPRRAAADIVLACDGAYSAARRSVTFRMGFTFREAYPDVVDLIPDLADDYLHNPIGSLATIRCWPWVHHGAGCTLALVGDAAHAIVPFFGQGANCAFEDCVEIDRCLDETAGDWTAALTAYQQRRKANCDAIADMALDNFTEMRDRVNSPVFRASTAARHFLERRLPGRYVSRYELVSFTTMPYAQIPARMRRQDRATALAAAGLTGAAGLLAAAVRAGARHGSGMARHGAARRGAAGGTGQ